MPSYQLGIWLESNIHFSLLLLIWSLSRKILGFIVNSRGIEANPDKIKAVLDMQSPSNTKEIQRLIGSEDSIWTKQPNQERGGGELVS